MTKRLDHPIILESLFHPREEQEEVAPGGIFPVRMMVGDGTALGCRLCPAAPRAPLVVLFHGNGEIAADYDDLALMCRPYGFGMLVVDYRGYGRSDGSPTAATLLSDAWDVFTGIPAMLASCDLQPERLIVMGRSLGSAAAIEIASRAGAGIQGVILESGFFYTIHLVRSILGFRAYGVDLDDLTEERDGFGHAGKMQRITVPLLVIHGEDDSIIPASDGKLLFDHAASASKEWLPIPNAGHNDLMFKGWDAYLRAMRQLAVG